MPKYTGDRREAACAFSLHTSYIEDLCANDISKGDGKDLYRYIQAHYHPDNEGKKVVKSVTLNESQVGDGQTADLNKDRGGRYLYLCWNLTN